MNTGVELEGTMGELVKTLESLMDVVGDGHRAERMLCGVAAASQNATLSHCGVVFVHSTAARGTAFSVALPVHARR